MVKQPPHPHLNAIILCDQIYRESSTGKYTILGTFDAIWVRQFPVVHPVITAFINFSDAEGEYKPRIEVVYLDEDVVIGDFRPEEPIVARERLQSSNLTVVLQGVEFKKAGKYAIRIFLNDQFLGDRPFHVIHREE